MTLRAIIVDDEPLARALLTSILDDIDAVEIVATCANGYEAVEAVLAHAPDMMFLDIEMPEMNGFDVIRAIQSDLLPKIIFTTAYAQYAVEAFRVQAINYVLKPLDDNAIAESVERVRSTMSSGQNGATKNALLAALNDAKYTAKGQSLITRTSNKIAFLDKADIDWIESSGDYVCIHFGEKTHLMRATLKSVLAQLTEFNFIRIHRSTIVNLDKVAAIHPAQKGEASVVMQSGQQLKVSRSHGAKLRNTLT